MTVFFHELKRNRMTLLIWSAVISFMLGVCIIIYPEMASQMEEMSQMFANMGSFSSAFGMDQINFGDFMGYFSIEYGNCLGLGAAFFAAITGICSLSKEEKDRTAEFLLTHPISRTKIVAQKFLSVIAQIIIMNIIVALITCISILIIGQELQIKTIALIMLAYFILQIQISAVTFSISAFLSGNGLGIGLGLAFWFYFANIISNLVEEAEFIKCFTPFSYTNATHIVNENSIELKYLVVGLITAIISILIAFIKYTKKDIT